MNIEEALKHYSEEEVIQHLEKSDKYGPSLKQARDYGYSDKEYIQHLASRSSQGEKPSQPKEESYFANPMQGYAGPPRTPEELSKSIKNIITGAASGATLTHPDNPANPFMELANQAGLGPGKAPGSEERPEWLDTQSPEFIGGQVLGEAAPISAIFKLLGPAPAKMAMMSPVFKKQVSALTNFMKPFLAGSTLETGKQLTAGDEVSADEVFQHGAMWQVLDAALRTLGWGGRFASAMAQKSQQMGEKPQQVLGKTLSWLKENGYDASTPERTTAKFLEILEDTKEFPRSPASSKAVERDLDLGNKTPSATPGEGSPETIAQKALGTPEPITPKDLSSKKFTDQTVDRIDARSEPLAEPITPSKVKTVDVAKEAQEARTQQLTQVIESSGRKRTDQELGQDIQKSAKEGYEAEIKDVAEDYDAVKADAQKRIGDTKGIRQSGKEVINKIESLATKPEGFKKALEDAQNALNDAGYVIQRDPNGKIDQIIKNEDTTVDQLIELAKRLNKIVNYETIDFEARNMLIPLKNSVKQSIRDSLKTNKKALARFNLAEQKYADTSKRYNRNTIRKARTEEAGESIAGLIKNPTGIDDLRAVLPEVQMADIERKILERLNGMERKGAEKAAAELLPKLSKENRKIARDILESKKPMSAKTAEEKLHQAVIDDLSKAFTTGTRPNKTMELWQTPKGQKVVRQALKNSPNKAEVLGYLEKQASHDLAETVVSKDGKINFSKLSDMMKDPGVSANIYALGGQDAVNFFRGLEKRAEQMKKFNGKYFHETLTPDQQLRLDEKLNKAKDKLFGNTTKALGERAFGKQGFIPARQKELSDSSQERGRAILTRMSQKDYPIKKLTDWVKDNILKNTKVSLTMWGLFSGKLIRTISAIQAKSMLYKMATNPKYRAAWKKASEKHSGISDLIDDILKIQEFD